jgi:tetratricopeptide (TPR) repeat protein
MLAFAFPRINQRLSRFALLAVIGVLSPMAQGQHFPESQNLHDPFDVLLSPIPSASEERPVPLSAGLISITRALHRIPKDAAALFKRAVRQKKEQPMEALANFREATRLDPLYWEAHANLAELYWQSGQKGAALDSLNAALAIDPNSEALQTDKSVALLALGHPEDAEQAAWSALRLKPGSEEAHYLIGLAQLRQGKVEPETVAHFAQAIGKIPQARQLHADAQDILSHRHR